MRILACIVIHAPGTSRITDDEGNVTITFKRTHDSPYEIITLKPLHSIEDDVDVYIHFFDKSFIGENYDLAICNPQMNVLVPLPITPLEHENSGWIPASIVDKISILFENVLRSACPDSISTITGRLRAVCYGPIPNCFGFLVV